MKPKELLIRTSLAWSGLQNGGRRLAFFSTAGKAPPTPINVPRLEGTVEQGKSCLVPAVEVKAGARRWFESPFPFPFQSQPGYLLPRGRRAEDSPLRQRKGRSCKRTVPDSTNRSKSLLRAGRSVATAAARGPG